jgi:hypothetical protein
MSESMPGVSPVPGHLHTVRPRLVVRDGAAAIDFYVQAFAAQEISQRFCDPEGRLILAEVRIRDSVVMITEESADATPAKSPQSPSGVVSAIMATYWEDVEAAGNGPWPPVPRSSIPWQLSSMASAAGDSVIPLASNGCSVSGTRSAATWTDRRSGGGTSLRPSAQACARGPSTRCAITLDPLRSTAPR